MEYFVEYLVIGILLARAYRIYFKNEPAHFKLSHAEFELIIVAFWPPILATVAICVIAAAVIDYFKR